MKKAAVIFAQGCEEGEALTIVDILRRAELKCDMVGLDSQEITGAHDVTMRTDKVLTEDVEDYDMIVLPGGYGGTDAMAASELLKTVLKNMNEKGKYIAAMCAAPIALDAAGLLEGKTFTCYPGTADKIHSGTRTDDKVVVDGNLITSRGPATTFPFAFKLAGVLGGNVEQVKQGMLYNALCDSIKNA
jgi:4-methyl-5(b-hydroxyethyl)-thiazole monophosphate biosynthesis